MRWLAFWVVWNCLAAIGNILTGGPNLYLLAVNGFALGVLYATYDDLKEGRS